MIASELSQYDMTSFMTLKIYNMTCHVIYSTNFNRQFFAKIQSEIEKFNQFVDFNNHIMFLSHN